MNITTLDISGNPGLERLFCSETGISALDISNSPALRSLDFTDSKLNAAAVIALFKSLPSRNGDNITGHIYCGMAAVFDEKLFAIARAKNWELNHEDFF